MKRWILLLGMALLADCGQGNGSRPASLSASPMPAAQHTAAVPSVIAPSAAPTAAVTRAAVGATTKTAGSTPFVEGVQPMAIDRRVLPSKAADVILGPPISVCAGDGLLVADDGTIYTLGQHDGHPCASAIDLATGSIGPAAPEALSLPLGGNLEVSDPPRARFYVAENGRVIAYGCCGVEKGTVLVLPPGEPGGATHDTALRLSEVTGHLYLSYQDDDGENWIASVDLNTGETITDVPILPGPWELVTDQGGIGDGRQGNLLFFASTSTLLVLDAETLESVNRLSLSRRPVAAVIDPSGTRLFVADAGGDLHVLDPMSLIELDRLSGVGTAVDLDPQLSRLYVGDRYSDGVNVFDLPTLKLVGRIPQPGRPVASPADGRVYILEEDVYQADGTTLQLIEGRTIRKSGCEGCIFPTSVVVDPRNGRVYTTTSILRGESRPSTQAVVDAKTGRAFVARTTGGPQPAQSLAIYPDLSLEEPMAWIDGLYGQLLYNPLSDQLFLARSGRLLVIDGQTLELLGDINAGDDLALLVVDGLKGSLFAAQGERLLRFGFSDGSADALEPEPVEGLPGPVHGIVVSPGFDQDATLFVQATDCKSGLSSLYRSTDGGKSWVHTWDGLPAAPTDLVFAPGGRLYAAVSGIGWRMAPEAAIWGQGVYVSEDGGDTWRPDNAGLTHLRVGRLHVANVADGGFAGSMLYARAAAAVEPGHVASGPTIWVRLPDREWTPVAVPGAGPLRLEDGVIPDTYNLAVQSHWHELSGGGPLYQSWGQELQRSDDGGRTWHPVGPGPTGHANELLMGSGDVYWLGLEDLWRSTDDGATWVALRHPDLDGTSLFSVTVADVGGAETLFLGTETGRVLVVPVAGADWE